jgi:hypothetical protein
VIPKKEEDQEMIYLEVIEDTGDLKKKKNKE